MSEKGVKNHLSAEAYIPDKPELDDFERFCFQETKKIHPTEIVKRAFPGNVMRIISNDHHKHKDGILTISYDWFCDEWFIEHPGYIRESEGSGKSYAEAAEAFLSDIQRANEKVMYRELEEDVNLHLDDDISVEIGEGFISIYKVEKGENRLVCLKTESIEDATTEKIVAEANAIIEGEWDEP